MRTRAVSSIGVVVIGLLPALFGGPVFALLMAGLGVAAHREFVGLATRLMPPTRLPHTGYAVVALMALAALVDRGSTVLVVGVAAVAISAPLIAVLLRDDSPAPFVGWALAAAGSLYLGLPVYAAVALRGTPGDVDARWWEELATATSFGWAPAPRGLAWLLIVILATWLGDTFAFLVGRRWGRRPLHPRVSPNKTIEGSIAGLAGSVLAGGVGTTVFGLGVAPWAGAGVGLGLGLVGQLGDLAESLLKRQVGVKDSGTVIPGHGGVLDRIDALLFALAIGWPLAEFVDRFGR